MLLKFLKTQDYLYNIPAHNSSAGTLPTRGIYTRVLLSNGKFIWLDKLGLEMQNEGWINELNKHIGENGW